MKIFTLSLTVFGISCYLCCPLFAEFDNVCMQKVRQAGLDGSHSMQEGKIQEAIQSFKNGLELCKKCFSLEAAPMQDRNKIIPLYLPLYIGLSGSYISLKNPLQAVAVCEEASKIIPEFAWSFRNTIAALYSSQGEYQKAIEICNTTLQLFPDSDSTYHILGRIYYKAGDSRNARINLQKSLVISRRKGNNSLIKETRDILRKIP